MLILFLDDDGVSVTVDQFDKSGTSTCGDEDLPDTLVIPCRVGVCLLPTC